MRRQSNLADFNDCHHEARQYWIQQMLPSAKAILDLGGGSAFNMDGALLEMGYSKNPEKITIIDFPPDDRVASAHSSLERSQPKALSRASRWPLALMTVTLPLPPRLYPVVFQPTAASESPPLPMTNG